MIPNCTLPQSTYLFCKRKSSLKFDGLFQSEILSRKSSASSTGSASEKQALHGGGGGSNGGVGSQKQPPFMRHDEHSIKSVRAKIAMFSNSNSRGHQGTPGSAAAVSEQW